MGQPHGQQGRGGVAGVRLGPDWFERLVGGLAEQPNAITGAVRSMLPGWST